MGLKAKRNRLIGRASRAAGGGLFEEAKHPISGFHVLVCHNWLLGFLCRDGNA
jgi:hypothetical protein